MSPSTASSGRAAAPTGPVPDDVAADLDRLTTALDIQIPAKRQTNLLIGTWNIRALSDLTTKWRAADRDSPKRDWHALVCLAEVVSRFDVLAVQEARRNTTALFALLERLGPQWRVIASDVTEGNAGNDERLAFLYDADRVQPSGLVGEIVLPPAASGPVEQFARTPYAAGFVRGETEFILTTVHVLWGRRPADRLPELTAFAEWMRSWADRPRDWNRNLMVLGDFNLDRMDDPLYQAFVATGLWPPAQLNEVSRTIFDDTRSRHFYDQIAWFCDPTDPRLPSLMDGLLYTGAGGGFDFVPHVMRDRTRTELSWRMSDHYPLWVEFLVTPV